ncbi:malate dehydrogenase [Dactylosporangium sucinum]|uniref:Malate dehydrogenase n=2 Tax=Dactylosporangium sucinum TaxID=1424081 RepID=A0A917TK96_9ACTN|nr:malate dehydrogenase [Dactylosporangium sucinum]
MVLTVRADTQDEAVSSLDFLEPGWGVAAVRHDGTGDLPGRRQLLVQVGDEAALHRLRRAASLDGRVVACTDRLRAMSAGGPIEVRPRPAFRAAEDLALLYTRGAARLAATIAADPGTASELTGRSNRVAVISDGSAVPGLGDLGPTAALPSLEAKAALCARLAGIDAVPICLDMGLARDADGTVAAVRAIAPTFGAIILTGIASPVCSDIERRLRLALDIPVFHDEQHGLPVVVLAGLRNALRVADKHMSTARVVILGTGVTAGAVTRLLLHAGVSDVTVCTPHGILGPQLRDLPAQTAWLAQQTNPRRLHGPQAQALAGADAVVDLSPAARLDQQLLATMAQPPVVFALSGPEPPAGATAITATDRPGHPNHITDLLAFPGILRGLLDAGAPRVTTDILLAATDVLAGLVSEDALGPHRLLPDVLDPQVPPTMAAAVAAVEASRCRARPRRTAG